MQGQAGTARRHVSALEVLSSADATEAARFRTLTASGNAAFARGDDAAAAAFYGQALDEAERILDRATTRGGCRAALIAPMVLTIAYGNLASARERAGASAEAAAQSVTAAERLIATAEGAGTPLVLRLNCIRHLRHALSALTDGPHDTSTLGAIAARATQTAAEVIRIAEACRGGEPPPGARLS